ncbi:hypothetical protein L2E82_29603 [Cichorium intybus]|uniref:Uncharacterized protein n=1 Tax=Cichorium intybus TaxID=13427 RepID=A0ACB9CY21_CICIN|nr:hypothetical protein L2E82_29603 [Cichorium intybus]
MSSNANSESLNWNSLATGVGRVQYNKFYNRRGIYRQKRVLPARTVNWQLTQESGIMEHLQDWLVQGGYEEGALTDTCQALENAFNMTEPVYREIILQLLSSYHFEKADTRMDSPDTVQFRLGNHNRNCSLREFGHRIGLYTEEESETPAFRTFHRWASCTMSDSFSPGDFWSMISSARYHENTIRESYMHLPAHRMLHRLIATTLWPRADEERVLPHELYLMWAVTRMLETCNIPYMIADYFKELTDAPLTHIALGGGHFVTRLARSYGLLSEHTTRELGITPPIPLSPTVTTSRDIIYVEDGMTSVDHLPFLTLRSEPSTSKKKSRVTVSLP